MTLKLEGMMPPHVTPFSQEGEIDEPALRCLLRFWLNAGVNGLVTCGSNGEAAYMTREERKKTIKIVVDEVNGRVPIIAGTGAPGTRETIILTRDAKEVGADAALVVTPYFFKPCNEELLAHYHTILNAVDIPLILYNVPKFTGYNLDPSVVIELAKEYSQIVGIKDSYGSIGQISEILRKLGNKISVLAGSGDLVLPTLIMGGRGGILGVANVAPQLCSAIYNNYKLGKLEKARTCQMQVLYLNEILIKRYNQISSIKEALNQLGKPAGYPRLPSLPLNEEGCQTVRRTLLTLNLELA
ncbi:MAG: 4-hydroxy-tetrahydrodipicolinate synthase [Candidatus Bathyarchaeota archaeon]|nr:MAG: 4-hydroxy-tetrahydrodipicolinate synthase [Candidatus Bathyarchaeota archaeon]